MQPGAPGCCAVAAPGRERASAGFEVADIVRHYGEAYRQAYAVPPAHQKVLDAIAACRTATLGGHAEWCPHCGFERYAYNSCRNRHCPKCQTLTKTRWLEARKAELLPVPSFHAVFTLPHELNALVLGNKRVLLAMLFKATSETLLQFGRQNLGGQLGAIMVLHTWDQQLRAHFHIHSVIPAGALASNAAQWIATHPRFLFPVQALSTVFREKFLDAMSQAVTNHAVTFAAQTAKVSTPIGFARLQAQLRKKAWVVYVKKPFAGPEHVLDYVGRYTHRVAIANHRIVDVRGGHVRFTYRDRRQGDVIRTRAIEACEFIRRFLLHVLPHGFVRIRHIGFLANRCKARALGQCRQLLGQPPETPAPCAKSVAEWMQQWTGMDLTRCPHCGAGPLLRRPLPPPGQRDGAPLPPPIFDSS
jgi:hypothetical protein